MKSRFILEFLDEPWVPRSLKITVREALNVTLVRPFRRYYDGVAEKAMEIIRLKNIRCVAEAGAGTAPISFHLARNRNFPGSVKLIPSDRYPDAAGWRILEKRFPGIVGCEYNSVDFTALQVFEKDSLVVLPASFHHIPFQKREAFLNNLSGHNVLICEPIRRNWFSLFLVLLGVFPTLLTPIALLGRPGRLRRVLWCWLIPAAAGMIVWDGIVSCFRCWTEQEWREHANHLLLPKTLKIGSKSLTTYVSW